MFKIIAAVVVTTAGAGYGLYTYTDLFDGGSHSCPLSGKGTCGLKPAPVSADSDCCAKNEECCEVVASCCQSEKVAAKAKPAAGCSDVACCSAKPASAATKAALCCADPCLLCAFLACEGCSDCVLCCLGEATNARAAVAGPAAVFAATK